MDKQSTRSNAPWLPIPDGTAISVEHPCYIKHDVEKAIAMLGGAPAISQALGEGSETTFALSFRPDDPSSRTVIANKKEANNVLLQIRVPQRTGRKRKRGSDGPWIDCASHEAKKDATYMVRSMMDNPNKYSVTALSAVDSMHIWRSMPDFAYSTSHVKILDDVKSKLLSMHYPTIKEFDLPITHGLQDTTTLPPAIWSQQTIPQNYTYRQNPSVKVINDPTTGQRVVKNTQAPPKIYSYQMQWDDTDYPTAPNPKLHPLAEQSQLFQKTVAALEALFQDREIWTRRALLNRLESDLSSFNVVRFCLAYVAYALRSGPWRDTYVRLGVDPRKDPKYRFYQTIMLQLVPKENPAVASSAYRHRNPANASTEDDEEAVARQSTEPAQPDKAGTRETRYTYARFWSRSNDPTSHIFDGVSPLPPDGKIWQLCDITDPQMTKLRDLPEKDVRPTCESRYFGWYYNGTYAKMRVCMKAKTEALQKGRVLDTQILEGFLSLPEHIEFLPEAEAVQEQIPTADGATHGKSITHNTSSTAAVDASEVHPEQQRLLTVETRPLEMHQPNDTLSQPLTGKFAKTTTKVPYNHEALSACLGPEPTKQQLDWLALYRAFARAEPGQKPVTGSSVHRTNPVSKPVLPTVKRTAIPSQNRRVTGRTRTPANEAADNINSVEPMEISEGEQEAAAPTTDGPGLAEGEEILPSIELNVFDVDEDDDSELGLDIDPEIKLEDDDEDRLWMDEGADDEALDANDPHEQPLEPVNGDDEAMSQHT